MEREKDTRKQRIDPKLRAAGWTVVPFDDSMPTSIPSGKAVREWPTAYGPADYTLCDEGEIRAVTEAKKLTVGAQGILPQAERYSREFPAAIGGRASTACRSCTQRTASRSASRTSGARETARAS